MSEERHDGRNDESCEPSRQRRHQRLQPRGAQGSARPWGGWGSWVGLLATVVVAAGLSAIAYAGHLPPALTMHHADKAVHAVMAGSLVFFLDLALGRRDLRIGRHCTIAWSVVLVLIPVAIDEALQHFATHRTASIWDFAADAAGAFAFARLARLVASPTRPLV